MAKQKFDTHVSPAGIAVYPWLNKADTKFDADGVFSVKLIFDKAATQNISDIVKPLMNGGAHNPIKHELDDQGEKTGQYVANFKMKAHVKHKYGLIKPQQPLKVLSHSLLS